jgi:hypothetical protein
LRAITKGDCKLTLGALIRLPQLKGSDPFF